jgi:hypothetical protein
MGQAYYSQADLQNIYASAQAQIASKTERKTTMLADARKYVSDNRDLIYTVIFVAILDHLLFDGAFREKIKSLVDGFLNRAQAKHAATE